MDEVESTRIKSSKYSQILTNKIILNYVLKLFKID